MGSSMAPGQSAAVACFLERPTILNALPVLERGRLDACGEGSNICSPLCLRYVRIAACKGARNLSYTSEYNCKHRSKTILGLF